MANKSKGSTPYPGMMGDGTEEQNLGQVGDPSARITEEEVDQAFGATAPAQAPASTAGRAFAPKVKEGIEASQAWVGDKADAARRWSSDRAAQAEQVISERPAIVITASALSALVVGLVAGFLIGRLDAERDRGLARYWRH
jgi:ElaB/YqjD/DUF883 family membrane-anchored ribosome-binding protein